MTFYPYACLYTMYYLYHINQIKAILLVTIAVKSKL